MSATELWPREALELYADGELDDVQSARLADDLRADPALRDRLREVNSLDQAMTGALASTSARAHRRFAPVRVAGAIGAIAAAAAGAIFVADAIRTPRRALRAVEAPIAAIQAFDPPARVVLRLPAREVREIVSPSAPNAPDRAHRHGADLASLDVLLTRGDAAAAAAMIRAASVEEREAVFSRMGELLQSVATAERVLDALDVESQIQACRAWASDSRVQTAVFRRLRDLRDNAAASTLVSETVSDLSRRRELSGWLRGYGLASERLSDG